LSVADGVVSALPVTRVLNLAVNEAKTPLGAATNNAAELGDGRADRRV
jgi:hypothetical protein